MSRLELFQMRRDGSMYCLELFYARQNTFLVWFYSRWGEMGPCIVWNYSMQDKIYDSSGTILDKIKFMSRLELSQMRQDRSMNCLELFYTRRNTCFVWNYSRQDKIHDSSGIILDKCKHGCKKTDISHTDFFFFSFLCRYLYMNLFINSGSSTSVSQLARWWQWFPFQVSSLGVDCFFICVAL